MTYTFVAARDAFERCIQMRRTMRVQYSVRLIRK